MYYINYTSIHWVPVMFQLLSAIDCMFVSPSFCVEALNLNLVALGNGAFGQWLIRPYRQSPHYCPWKWGSGGIVRKNIIKDPQKRMRSGGKMYSRSKIKKILLQCPVSVPPRKIRARNKGQCAETLRHIKAQPFGACAICYGPQ